MCLSRSLSNGTFNLFALDEYYASYMQLQLLWQLSKAVFIIPINENFNFRNEVYTLNNNLDTRLINAHNMKS